jgi:Domain of unknown function (DUF5666)
MRRFAVAIGMLLLAGCTAAPPPAPTQAPVPPTQAPAPAPTQPLAVAVPAPTPASSNVTGAIDAITGRTLTVTTPTGAKEVQLADDARIEKEGRGTLADLQPGLSVGITGRPDGANLTAVSIRIFPAAQGTPRPGQFPMTGANAGNVMTNSVIESFDGSTLTVSAAGQRFEIRVPSDAEVLKPVSATLGDLSTGTRVLAAGAAAPDGSFRATSINVVGLPPQ